MWETIPKQPQQTLPYFHRGPDKATRTFPDEDYPTLRRRDTLTPSPPELDRAPHLLFDVGGARTEGRARPRLNFLTDVYTNLLRCRPASYLATWPNVMNNGLEGVQAQEG